MDYELHPLKSWDVKNGLISMAVMETVDKVRASMGDYTPQKTMSFISYSCLDLK